MYFLGYTILQSNSEILKLLHHDRALTQNAENPKASRIESQRWAKGCIASVDAAIGQAIAALSIS